MPLAERSLPGHRSFPELGPHDILQDPGLVRETVRKLIPGCGVRNTRRHLQHFRQELALVIATGQVARGRFPI